MTRKNISQQKKKRSHNSDFYFGFFSKFSKKVFFRTNQIFQKIFHKSEKIHKKINDEHNFEFPHEKVPNFLNNITKTAFFTSDSTKFLICLKKLGKRR